MSDPTDTSPNGEYSKRREESSESFSPEKRQCQSPSPIAAEPTVSKHQLLVGISTLADDVAPTTTASSHEKTIFDLPDDVLALSLAFVGKGTFRYTASVCKTFHRVYKRTFHDTTDTSIGSVIATIDCAEMFLEEEGGENIDIDIDNKALYIWNGAARHGRVEILEWMNKSSYSNCFDIKTSGVVAEHGHLDALKWLHAHGCPIDESIDAAASAGHLPIVQWCRANGCPWNESACTSAAEGGHLSVLQWCRANDCPWDESTCSSAALGGHLSLLQWCHANGCPWDKSTCSRAAYGGHLSVLQWCRANGCPWDKSTCEHAAYGGHLSVLQWCRANDCPWDERTCKEAAAKGHLSVLQWCRANGCPQD
jgi:hypothetical protein